VRPQHKFQRLEAPPARIEMKRGKSTDEIGVIAAPTKTDAIRQAIKTFEIPVVLQNLLVVSQLTNRE
jgi:hypothetical protein